MRALGVFSRMVAMGARVALALVVSCGTASAGPVLWTDWTAATLGTPGAATGTLGSIGVTYVGQVHTPTQVAGGTNYWLPNAPYLSATVSNEPPAADIITLVGGPTLPANTLTFSSPVTNPLMAIVSLGQPAVVVQYIFGAPFDVISFGPGFWGGPGTLTEFPGNLLVGVEGHGVIQFQGTFTSISWTVPIAENWHGFQIGIEQAAVPEPGTALLLGLGFGALALSRLRRRQR